VGAAGNNQGRFTKQGNESRFQKNVTYIKNTLLGTLFFLIVFDP
jgi:hypothetical protein